MDEEPFAPSFMDELPLARAALAYAQELRQGQRRASDEAPFILHPLEVAALLHNTGHPAPVVAAGILHDTVEDTGASLDEIRNRFGEEVSRASAPLRARGPACSASAGGVSAVPGVSPLASVA